MTLALVKTVASACGGYVLCRAFDLARPFEKAAVITTYIGLKTLAYYVIYGRDTKYSPMNSLLLNSANLLAIPCAFIISRQLNFATTDTLMLLGIALIIEDITFTIGALIKALPG